MMNSANLQKIFETAYEHIHDCYADDASFLWDLRANAINYAHYTREDVSELELRLDAALDGLAGSPEKSWQACLGQLELQQASDLFVAAILAFRSMEPIKIQQVVETGLVNHRMGKGLISAMAWLPGKFIHSWIKKFLTSKDLQHKCLALAVCSARREDPREYLTSILNREDCISTPILYARALRLIGELKRFDLMPALRLAVTSEDKNCSFWANWSLVMLGDKSVAKNLQEFVLAENPHQQRAIEMSFRVLPIDVGRVWIGLLAKDPANIRHVIKATATLGDPHAINWLIAKMRVPQLTRLTGEAFTTITGIDLKEHKLSLSELPDLEDQLPNEDPQDTHVDIHQDEHLVFPDVDKVAAVWQKYQQRFTPAQRYFMGQIPNVAHLQQVYAQAHQRQRKAAALDLALLQPANMLLNYAAKGVTP